VRSHNLGWATNTARSIELRYGLGGLGHVFIEEGAFDDFVRIPGLIAAVKQRLDQAAERATGLLSERMAALTAVAEALEQTGYLSGEEAVELMRSGSRRRDAMAARVLDAVEAQP